MKNAPVLKMEASPEHVADFSRGSIFFVNDPVLFEVDDHGKIREDNPMKKTCDFMVEFPGTFSPRIEVGLVGGRLGIQAVFVRLTSSSNQRKVW